MWWELILNALLLGVGLAMDACAVSMANGLNEPKMKVGKITLIAAMFAFFQALMPMIGWLCIHFVAQQFEVVTKIIPYLALVILAFIGGKMIFDGTRHRKKDGEDEEEKPVKKLTLWVILVQALATSIDALSVGFTIVDYDVVMALVAAAIIAVVTFGICFGAVFIGKKFGTSLGNKAEIIGGVILICIGIEIFVKGVFFS